MKTLILSMAAAAALTAGAASAQPYGYERGGYEHGRYYHQDGRWMPINERLANLDRRIDQGIRSGQLTRREAYRLKAQFRDIARLEYRYRSNGLSNWERADLDRRFDMLSQQIRWERRDGERYGYNDYERSY